MQRMHARTDLDAHLQILWHQHLAGLLDHGLRFELVFTEAVPPGVEVVLAGDAGQRHV